ncbi:hypothetical protein DICVIV_07283 [Dictyocaulus viviparus]|uniref:Uncharacterized protein n=1 Tax=Dictyocaulus viviparus TaxID=29172 RepID=A0A0D8XS94_DICVI|nr:hypothetical protein DICVIV_07283 [Dictyocaulus viviparus]
MSRHPLPHSAGMLLDTPNYRDIPLHLYLDEVVVKFKRMADTADFVAHFVTCNIEVVLLS